MSSKCRFKVSLELPTSVSGGPLITRPDADVGNSTQTSIAPSSERRLKKFAKPFERYQIVNLVLLKQGEKGALYVVPYTEKWAHCLALTSFFIQQNVKRKLGHSPFVFNDLYKLYKLLWVVVTLLLIPNIKV
jgi:hypothetical protein